MIPVRLLVDAYPAFPMVLFAFGLTYGPLARWVLRFYFKGEDRSSLLLLHRKGAVWFLKLLGLWVEGE